MTYFDYILTRYAEYLNEYFTNSAEIGNFKINNKVYKKLLESSAFSLIQVIKELNKKGVFADGKPINALTISKLFRLNLESVKEYTDALEQTKNHEAPLTPGFLRRTTQYSNPIKYVKDYQNNFTILKDELPYLTKSVLREIIKNNSNLEKKINEIQSIYPVLRRKYSDYFKKSNGFQIAIERRLGTKSTNNIEDYFTYCNELVKANDLYKELLYDKLGETGYTVINYFEFSTEQVEQMERIFDIMVEEYGEDFYYRKLTQIANLIGEIIRGKKEITDVEPILEEKKAIEEFKKEYIARTRKLSDPSNRIVYLKCLDRIYGIPTNKRRKITSQKIKEGVFDTDYGLPVIDIKDVPDKLPEILSWVNDNPPFDDPKESEISVDDAYKFFKYKNSSMIFERVREYEEENTVEIMFKRKQKTSSEDSSDQESTNNVFVGAAKGDFYIDKNLLFKLFSHRIEYVDGKPKPLEYISKGQISTKTILKKYLKPGANSIFWSISIKQVLQEEYKKENSISIRIIDTDTVYGQYGRSGYAFKDERMMPKFLSKVFGAEKIEESFNFDGLDRT